MKSYGKEVIIDLHECDPSLFTRKDIKRYFVELCELIDMKREKLCWWDDHGVPPEEQETEPHLKGTSAVQFIRTSNVVIHTLDKLKKVFINIFSCKNFQEDIAISFTKEFFKGEVAVSHSILRI